jgi:hypothetical protein
MKRQFMRVVNAALYSKSVKLVASLILIAGSFSAQAQTANNESPVRVAEVKHIGNTRDMMVFQVQVDNSLGERFSVVLKDTYGATLFNEVFKDKKFDKKFKVPKTEDSKVYFVIRDLANNSEQSFEVNSNTRVIEEVSVRRIIK